jgi:hypothetical protein
VAFFTASEWQLSMMESNGDYTFVNKGRRKNVYIPQYEPIPKTPYLAWFVKIGGNYNKNKMPRGRKFKRVIKPYLNGKYSIEMRLNIHKINLFRTKGPSILFDEMDKFNN